MTQPEMTYRCRIIGGPKDGLYTTLRYRVDRLVFPIVDVSRWPDHSNSTGEAEYALDSKHSVGDILVFNYVGSQFR